MESVNDDADTDMNDNVTITQINFTNHFQDLDEIIAMAKEPVAGTKIKANVQVEVNF